MQSLFILANMKNEVYCDESCWEALFDKSSHQFFVIGGIWIPSSKRAEIKNSINGLKQKYHLLGEMKWNKVTPATVEMYKELIHLFASDDCVRYRAICVEAAHVDNMTYNEGSGELGFYKFYFQLLSHWLHQGDEYQIFLDYKTNEYADRLSELKRILNIASLSQVSQVQALPSQQSAIIQMADVLTGIVAASFNNTLRGAKLEVCQELQKYLGHAIGATRMEEKKFNVFEINLRKSGNGC